MFSPPAAPFEDAAPLLMLTVTLLHAEAADAAMPFSSMIFSSLSLAATPC